MWLIFSLMLPLCVSAPEEASIAIPYDLRSGKWLFDTEGIVSRNDVVYDSLSPEPWDAMPTGGGDLSAMVRFDGEALHLHLTKSDAWGYQAPATDPPGTRYFNNVSPGHVRIVLGERGKALAAERFRQRLDLYHGRVTFELGNEPCTRIDVWGHPSRKVLVVEVADAEKKLGPISVELSEWRDTMQVSVEDGMAFAKETQTRPARPHMASAGMRDYFTDETDPMLGRGTSVAIGIAEKQSSCTAEGQVATFSIDSASPRCRVVITAAVTPRGDPLAAAKKELDDALATAPAQLRDEHDAWWREYWSKSFVRLESPDNAARWVTAAYHVHLYTLGCVNRGPVPAKWDGGAGLMRGDERTWGLAEWVQEIRFTFLPLYAANRLEMAKGLTNHYTRMLPYLREQTQKMWGIPGLWIPETVLPWGGVEDWVLDEDVAGCVEGYGRWDPATAPYGLFERYNRYVGFLFTCGPEVCWHYLTYYRYSGDEAFLKGEAYPVIRGVAEFVSGLLREGDDGKFHLNPANALETWWMVKDPSDAMDAVRWLFPEFIGLSERFGTDADLRARCAEQLARLPDPALGVWHTDGTIDNTIDAYAPAAAIGTPPKNNNFENPALYRVFPFGLSGVATPDHDRAVRTFENRIYPLVEAWALDPVWAARLGLCDEACKLLAEHAKKWNRFRYGGWDSGNSGVFPGELAVAPYTDAGGVACYALNEILLQSHNGLIRILPAIAQDWSGTFRLRAEGGFLVSVDFLNGKAQFVEITSLFGGECRLVNPWNAPCVVRADEQIVVETESDIISFATEPDRTYLVMLKTVPLSSYVARSLTDTRNDAAGLPGRDF